MLAGRVASPGALVCAAGANRIEARELDNAVLERATFVCCDSLEQARLEAGDLVEPVERGVLDWLEVHELAEVVGGETPGRQHDEDIVLFKSLGIAAEDVAVAALVHERAVERGGGHRALAEVLGQEVEQEAVVPLAVGAALVSPHHAHPLEADALVGADRPGCWRRRGRS